MRPSGLPRETSRCLRSPVEAGSMPYSAVTQPRPRPAIQRGTLSTADAVQITRVPPCAISAEPVAVRTKPGSIATGRSVGVARGRPLLTRPPSARERARRRAGRRRAAAAGSASRDAGRPPRRPSRGSGSRRGADRRRHGRGPRPAARASTSSAIAWPELTSVTAAPERTLEDRAYERVVRAAEHDRVDLGRDKRRAIALDALDDALRRPRRRPGSAARARDRRPTRRGCRGGRPGSPAA